MAIEILFVDDEPKLKVVIQQLFRRRIRSREYKLSFALNGVEALELLHANPNIDIVFTDLNMPKMNGLALLERLRTLKPAVNPVLTTVVISAYGDMENIRKAMNTGAFDFLIKPLDFEDVRITLAKVIEHVEHLKRIRAQERQAREALKRLNEELERRVKERTIELEKSNAELNAFAHTVAHDLKNPLSIIAGYVDYSIDFFNEIETDELLETMQYVREYSYRAASIIEELLLLSGVRKMKIPLTSIDMKGVLDKAQQRLTPMIKEYQAKIIVPESWPVARGYAPWVEEVWVNYLSNGLKYGGVPPRLEVGGELHNHGAIRFWVKDNGKGITSEDQPKLFTEFTRLNELRAEGHGLGLSIVRRIVEKLGGQVGVESQAGNGSKFYFTLPSASGKGTPII